MVKEKNLFKEVHFLDLGSGNGRSVLHMGLMDEVTDIVYYFEAEFSSTPI